MGLHVTLPLFRVLNFAWKISLPFSNSSLSVKVVNCLRAARSACGSMDENLTLPSQKYFVHVIFCRLPRKS
jgi:hypothetical protein